MVCVVGEGGDSLQRDKRKEGVKKKYQKFRRAGRQAGGGWERERKRSKQRTNQSIQDSANKTGARG